MSAASPAQNHQANAKKAKPKGHWKSDLMTVFWAIVIAIIIRAVLVQPFHIPSESMMPNLKVGDYILVTKYNYGFSRYSLLFGQRFLPEHKDRLFEAQPERGDVVVFRNPQNINQDYIKRVIGLPGDKVQLIEGRLYINDQPIARDLLSAQDIAALKSSGFTYYYETFDNQTTHIIQEVNDKYGDSDNTKAIIVKEDHYLMLGDNRDQSADSRYIDKYPYIGLVPKANLMGKAQVIVFSWAGLSEFFRLDRFFKVIQ